MGGGRRRRRVLFKRGGEGEGFVGFLRERRKEGRKACGRGVERR